MFRATLRTLVPLVLSLPACNALGVVGFSGIGVTVDPSGAYSVTVPDMAWTFSGNIGAPLHNLQTASGTDALGGYHEISFDFQAGSARHASIRSYTDHPDILFTVNQPSPDAANTFAFPNLTEYPRNLDHLTYSGIFAPPSFSEYAKDSPWIFFDGSLR